MQSMNIGLFGASGYSGLGLLGLRARHPRVKVVFAAGDRFAGDAVAAHAGPATRADTVEDLVAPEHQPVEAVGQARRVAAFARQRQVVADPPVAAGEFLRVQGEAGAVQFTGHRRGPPAAPFQRLQQPLEGLPFRAVQRLEGLLPHRPPTT